MKRLALLLAAMGIVSAAAFAEAPVLKVTNIGQSIEIENTSGNEDIADHFWFFNNVGMTYDNWKFGLQAGKMWTVDTEDGFGSTDSRLQLSGVRNYGNYYLGLKTRMTKTYDRYHALAGWNYDNLYGDFDVWYQANESAADEVHYEIFPIGVKIGGFKAAWFVEGWEAVGSVTNGQQESYMAHQLRFYAPLYTGEKLSLTTEYRLSLTEDKEYKEKAPKAYTTFKDGGRHRLYVRSNYNVTDNLSVFLNYGYQISKYEGHNETKTDRAKVGSDKYWGDVEFGWNYKF